MLFVRLRRRTALPLTGREIGTALHLKGREAATTASSTHYKPHRAILIEPSGCW
ncbi:MAG: hypothetical protein Q8O31_08805 [Rhodocyclaceae bacterium]|nr:hypothetical protein [Rhodocyclaceae bacterium]